MYGSVGLRLSVTVVGGGMKMRYNGLNMFAVSCCDTFLIWFLLFQVFGEAEFLEYQQALSELADV